MAINNFLTNPTNIAEIFALGVALCTAKGTRGTYWSLFSLFLLVTLSIESLGYYYRVVLVKPNYLFYNLFMVIQMAFFSILFYKFNLTKSAKVYTVLIFAMFIVFFAVRRSFEILLVHTIFIVDNFCR